MLKQNKFVAVIVSLILAFAIVLGVGVALITAGNTGRQMADTDVSTVNDEVTDVTTEEISYVPNDEPRYIVPSEASANKKEIPCTYKTITVGNQTINYIEVLNEAFNSMETAGTTTSYYLGTGIDMSGTGKGFVVRGTVYFDLNGQIISTGADETNTNPLFTVESGGKLIIYDSSDPGYGRNFLIDSDGMYNYNLTRAQASASPYASAGLGLITMCYSKGNGPVINIKSGGYAEFDGGVMGGNYSAAYGGAVYVASGGSFVMNGGSMLGNKAAYGGAIASDGGSVTITGTSTNHVFVSDNIATTNGAGIYTKGALTSSYAVIDGNKCTGGAGGGICAFASLNITGTDISNNSANGSGGGISSSGTPLNIYSSTLYDNTSTTNGGAICATNALFSNGNTIKGNTAQISGGGIYTACVTYLYSTTITRNVSVGDGGGVYIAFATAQPGVKVSGKVEIKENYKGATSILNTSDYSISSITNPSDLYLPSLGNSQNLIQIDTTLTDGTDIRIAAPNYTTKQITSNYSGICGTKEPAQFFSLDDPNYAIILQSNNVYTTSAVAKVTSAANYFDIGYRTADLTIDRYNTSYPTSNTFKYTNVNIPADNDKSITLLAENTVTAGKTLAYTGTFNLNGQVFKSNGGTTLIIGDGTSTYAPTITFNGGGGSSTSNKFEWDYADTTTTNKMTLNQSMSTADHTCRTGAITGGNATGLKILSGSTVNWTSGEVVGNEGNEGGGVAVYGGTFNMTGGLIIGNTANWGGGIFLKDGAVANISGSAAINYNGVKTTSGSGDGGGFHINNYATINLSGSATVTGNKARNGGGIYYNANSSTNVTVSGGTISSNTAWVSGGGVYAKAAFKFTGGKITGNKANGGDGGGVYITSGVFTMSASGSDAISSNTATGNGGGVYLDSSATAAISAGYIASNTAVNGGGIYSKSTNLTMTSGSHVTNNTATGNGGAFYLNGTSNLTGVDINAYKSVDGGAIYAEGGTTNIQDGTITSATGAAITGNGGGLYVSSNATVYLKGSASVSGITLKNNNSMGAGAYVIGKLYLQGTSSIKSCKTPTGGTGAGVYLGNDTITTSVLSLATGTSISGNNTTNSNGAGVYLRNGTFTLDGGTVSSNNAQSSALGGGVYVAGGTLTQNSGSITGNAARQAAGVALIGGTYNLYGGSVTSNAARENTVGGIYVNGGTLNLKGSPTVKDNTIVNNSTATASNIYLPADTYITVVGQITSGASTLGVTVATPFTPPRNLTSGYASSSTANSTSKVPTCFFLDTDTESEISINVDEVAIGKPIVKVTANNTSTNYSVWTTGLAAYNGASNATITLLANIPTTDVSVFTANGTFDLNGYRLYYNGSSSNAVVQVDSSSLTIKDGTENTSERTHYYGVSGNKYVLSDKSATGTTTEISGGIISGGTNGGIIVNGGLTLASGTIAGNQGATYGGVLVNSAGTFTMNGGSIIGNYASTSGNANNARYYSGEISGGAGVRCYKTFNFYGGKISNNYSAYTGGGVYVASTATFTLGNTAGATPEISSNTAYSGGGVYLQGGIVRMYSGNIMLNVLGSGAYGGGVTVADNGTLNMVGGAIKLNKGNVGGVYLNNGTFNLGSGTITENSSGSTTQVGGIQVMTNGHITLSGTPTITGNVYAATSITASGLVGGTSQSNLYIYDPSNTKIVVSGKLGTNTQVGLTLTSYVAEDLTSGYATQTYSNKYFSLDNTSANVARTEKLIVTPTGEVGIGDPEASITANSVTTYYGYYANAVADFANTSDTSKTLTLLKDITTSSPNGATGSGFTTTGTLDLNGHILYTSARTGSNSAIWVAQSGITFTIKDSAATSGTHYYKVNASTGLYEYTDDDGAFFTTAQSDGGSITGGIIAGGYGSSGGGVYVESGTTLVVNGGTFSGNTAYGTGGNYGGGAIYAAGNLQINNSKFDGNYAANKGAAIYSNGTTTISGTSFVNNNAATQGGGLFVAAGTTTITDSTFTGNKSTNGGAIYVNGGTATMGGASVVSNNTSTSAGAINIGGGEFTLNGGTISGNTANYGGGVWVTRLTTFTMNGGTITGNNANTVAGGVYMQNSAVVNLSGAVRIVNNYLGGELDGSTNLYAYGTNGKESNLYICGNTSSNTTSKINITGALTSGTAQIGVMAEVVLPNAEYSTSYGSNNVSSGSAIDPNNFFYLDYMSAAVPNYTLGLSSGNEVTLLSATVKVESSVNHFGRGYAGTTAMSEAVAKFNEFTQDNAATITLLADNISTTDLEFEYSGIFDLNGHILYRSTSGSVIKVQNGAQLEIKDSTPSTPHYYTLSKNNSTYDYVSNYYRFYNNGFYSAEVVSGQTVTGGIITGVTAVNGGGVYVSGASTVLTMNGGTIAGNAASNYGAGLYITNDATVKLNSGAKIEGNNATWDGGGVFVASGTLQIDGGVITNNSAPFTGTTKYARGGGVYLESGTLNLISGEISNNKAARFGGGVYVGHNNNTGTRTFQMTGGTISGNSVKSGNNSGGGIYLHNGDVTISGNAQITGNYAGNGGGIYLYGGTLNLNGGTISGNNTSLLSGGVHFVGGTFNIQGSPVITGNSKGATISDDAGVTAQGTVDSNIYIVGSANKLTVTGAISGNAKISVSPSAPAEGLIITDAYGTNNNNSGTIINGTTGDTTYFCLDDDETLKNYVMSVSDTSSSGEICLISAEAKVTNTQTNKTTSFAKFNDAVTYYNTLDNSTLTILKNITTDETAAFTKSGTFDLNGFMLKYSSTDSSKAVASVVTVAENITLTLTDSDSDNEQYYKASTTGFTISSDATGSDGRMQGGFITGGRSGGIVVSGTLIMNNGSVAGNYGLGGIIVKNDATFTMTGGTITGNYSANYGGGVYVYSNATFTMTGGNINNNNAGAVYSSSMTSSDTAAVQRGGGVYLENGANFQVGGTAIVTNNTTGGTLAITGTQGGVNNNVQFGSAGAKITVLQGITSAIIGVTPYNAEYTAYSTASGVAFTVGCNANANGKGSSFFSSDDSHYIVTLNASNECIFASHTHDWAYEKDGNTLKIYCRADESTNGKCSVEVDTNNPNLGSLFGSITLTYPTGGSLENGTYLLTYSGTANDASYVIENLHADAAGEHTLQITYEYATTVSNSYNPTNTTVQAGKYKATLTILGGKTGSDSANKTTTIEYTVCKKTLTVAVNGDGSDANEPNKNTITYGDTFTPSVTVTGFVGKDNLSSLSGTLAYKYYDSTGNTEVHEYEVGKEYGHIGTYVIGINGYESDNYTFDYNYGTLVVESQALNIVGFGTIVKDYDGTTGITNRDAVLANVQFDDLVAGDTITITSVTSITFSSANVGVRDVRFVGIEFGGDISNYTFATRDYTFQGEIKQRKIYIDQSSLVINDKTYDGTDLATYKDGLNVLYLADGASTPVNGIVNEDINNIYVDLIVKFADKNAGDNKVVRITNATLKTKVGGVDVTANYLLETPTFTTTGNILKRNVAIIGGVTVADKVYDGTKDATVTIGNVVFDEKLDNDDLTVVQVADNPATFESKNAGNNIKVTIPLKLSGNDNANYTLKTKTSAGTYSDDDYALYANISPIQITVGTISTKTRQYDGTTNVEYDTDNIIFADQAGHSNITTTGDDDNAVSTIRVTYIDFVSGEDVNLVINGNFNVADPAPATYTFDVNLSLASTSANYVAGNYTIVNPTQTVSFQIDPRQITVSGITAKAKTYDGTTDVELDKTNMAFTAQVASANDVANLFDGLDVEIISAFSTKNAGDNVAVTVSSLTLIGDNASKFDLITEPTDLTLSAKISKLEIKVTGIRASNKTYDGNANATININAISFEDGEGNPLTTGDNLKLKSGYTGEFDNKNAGEDKVVTISNLQLSDEFVNNYDLSISGTITATIFKREISVSGITGNSKYYDGSNIADIDISNATVSGYVDGEEIHVTNATGVFSDDLAGNNKTIMLTINLDFRDSSITDKYTKNYTLSANSQTTCDANIYKVELGIFDLSADNKEYDGNANATVNYVFDGFYDINDSNKTRIPLSTYDMLLNIENASFDNANIGEDKEVSFTLSLSGDKAQNFVLTTNNNYLEQNVLSYNAATMRYVLKANITRKGVTVRVTSKIVEKPDVTNNILYVTFTGERQLMSISIVDGVIAADENDVTASIIRYIGVIRNSGNAVWNQNDNSVSLGSDSSTNTSATFNSTNDAPKFSGAYCVLFGLNNDNYYIKTIIVGSESVTYDVTAPNITATTDTSTSTSWTRYLTTAAEKTQAASGQISAQQFIISPIAVDKPAGVGTGVYRNDYTYNGNTITFELNDSDKKDYYTLKNNTGINAGTYDQVTVAFVDKIDYYWSGLDATDNSSSDPLPITFEIQKMQVEVPVTVDTVTYNGQYQQYLPDVDSSVSHYTSNLYSKRDAGVYNVTISLVDEANMEWKDLSSSAALTRTFTINKKQVGISGITVKTKTIYDGEYQTTVVGKVYDGTDTADIDYSNVIFSGVETGDSLHLTSITGKYASADVYYENGVPAAQTVTLGGLRLSGNGSDNYEIDTNSVVNPKATIMPARLSFVGIFTKAKTYDGTNYAEVYTNNGVVTINGLVGQENFTVLLGENGSTAIYTNVDAYNGKTFDSSLPETEFETPTLVTVKLAPVSGTGAKLENYTWDLHKWQSTVSPAYITVDGIGAESKEYDGNTSVVLTNVRNATLTGVASGDTIYVEASNAAFENAQAGNNKNVYFDLTIAGDQTKIANYRFGTGGQLTSSGKYKTTANITPKTLTISLPDVSGEYNGNPYTASYEITSLLASGENESVLGLTINYTGIDSTSYTKQTVAPTNAGTYKISAEITNTNYSLATTEAALTITKKMVSSPVIPAKAYNAEHQVADVPTSDQYFVVTNNGGTEKGSYDVFLQLNDVTNYAWQAPYENNPAQHKAVFIISGAVNRITITQFSGWTYGDAAVEPRATAEYDPDKIAFEYSTTSAKDGVYSIDVPTEAGTYYLKAFIDNNTDSYVTDDVYVEFEIAKRPVRIENIEVVTKTYDNSDLATLDYTKAMSGLNLASGDNITISAEGHFTSKNASTNAIEVILTNVRLEGTASANYDITYKQSSAKGYITAKEVAINVSTTSKTYDGLLQSVTYDQDVATAALASGETLDNLGISYLFEGTNYATASSSAPKDVGDYKVTATIANSNYAIKTEPVEFSITKQDLVITARDININYGEATPTGLYDITGLVGNETIGSQTVLFDFQGYEAGSNAGTYTITPSGLTMPNYNITYNTAELNVAKLKLTISNIKAVSKYYDGTTDAQFDLSKVTYDGRITLPNGLPDDVYITNVKGTFAKSDVGRDIIVTINDFELLGNSVVNYEFDRTTDMQTTSVADINALTIYVKEGVAMANGGKVYDGTASIGDNGFDTTNAVIVDNLGNTVTLNGATLNVTGGHYNTVDQGETTVTIYGYELLNNNNGNYTLSSIGNQTETTATITPKYITIKGIEATDREYNGDVDINFDYSRVNYSEWRAATDGKVTVVANGVLNSKDASDTAQTVNITLSLTNNEKGNYIIADDSQSTLNAKVNKKLITAMVGQCGGSYGNVTPVTATPTAGSLVGDDTVTFTYNYSGTAFSGTSYFGDNAPANAGNYTAVVTLDDNNYTLSPIQVAFLIKKAAVDAPVVNNQTYNGQPKDSGIDDEGQPYTKISDNGGTDVGEYSVTLRLDDTDNYEWSDDPDNAEKIITYEIVYAKDEIDEHALDNFTGWTYGDDPADSLPDIKTKDGNDVKFTYALTEDGPYTDEVPTDVDKYWIKVEPSDPGINALPITKEFNIFPKEVFVDFTVLTKTYDGTNVANLDMHDATIKDKDGNAITDPNLNVESATAIYTNVNAGEGNEVEISDINLSGSGAKNYKVVYTNTDENGRGYNVTTGNIDKYVITVTGGLTAGTKDYDGTDNAPLEGTVTTNEGFIDGDDVRIVATGKYVTDGDDNPANVGEDKPIKVTLTLDGEQAGNYEIANEYPEELSGSVDKCKISITDGVVVITKPYDGTPDAKLDTQNATIDNIAEGDKVVIKATGVYIDDNGNEDPNAGENKKVKVTDFTIVEGGDNYEIVYDKDDPMILIGKIDKKTITVVGGLTAEDKVYDGTPNVNIVGEPQIDGIVSGDEDKVHITAKGVTVDENGNESKDAGSNKKVKVTLTLDDETGNYQLSSDLYNTDTDLTASTSRKQITVTGGISAEDKVYDGTTDAELNYDGVQFSTDIGNDKLTVTGLGTYENDQVGEQIVDITDLTLSGEDAGNYEFVINDDTQTETTARITASTQLDSLMWIAIVLGVSIALECVWIAVLSAKKNKLKMSVLPALPILAASLINILDSNIPEYEIIIILALVVIAFVLLLVMLLKSQSYFKARRAKRIKESIKVRSDSSCILYERSGENNTYVVTGLGNCRDKIVKISANVCGVPVTAIADNAFENCTSITGLILPPTISKIGVGAFKGCTALNDVFLIDNYDNKWYALKYGGKIELESVAKGESQLAYDITQTYSDCVIERDGYVVPSEPQESADEENSENTTEEEKSDDATNKD